MPFTTVFGNREVRVQDGGGEADITSHAVERGERVVARRVDARHHMPTGWVRRIGWENTVKFDVYIRHAAQGGTQGKQTSESRLIEPCQRLGEDEIVRGLRLDLSGTGGS